MKKLVCLLMLLLCSSLQGQTSPHWLQLTGKPFVDVRSYGAKGDGLTNDTVAIQAALTAAGGTKPVMIADGNFVVSTLVPLSNTMIFGNAIITHAQTEATSTCNIFDLTNKTGVVIDGLTLDGVGYDRTRASGTSPALITGDTVTDVIITGVTLKNGLTTAIEMSRVSRLLVSGCRVLNTPEHGIYISTNSNGVKVVNCEFRNIGTQDGLTTPQPCIRGRLNVSNVLVSGCSYMDDPELLLPVDAVSLTRFAEFSDQGSGSIASEPCHNIAITNNTGSGLTEGVFVSNPFTEVNATNTIVNLIMTGNNFTAKTSGSTYGVVLGKVTGVKVSDNFLSGFNYGIYAGGYSDLHITGNTIEGPDSHADSVDGISLRHTVYNGTTAGMPSRNAKVESNNVWGYKRYPLFMQHVASQVIISKNNLYSTLNRALQIELLDGVTSADATGSATYWITENRLQTGSSTAQVSYINNAPNIDVRVLFKNNVVINMPGTASTFSVFNGSESYDISGNLWSGGSQPFSVSPEANAYVTNNTGVFSMASLATTTTPGSGTVVLGPNNLPGGKQMYGLSAAPTVGTWAVGDKVFFVVPTTGGKIGSVCTVAGTPGTWKSFGAID